MDAERENRLGGEFRELKALEVSSGSIPSAEHLDHNDDTILINQYIDLYGVLDGMGGHKGGAEASRVADESIRQTYLTNVLDVRRPLSVAEEKEVMKAAIGKAHLDVLAASKTKKELAGMGTTASVVRFMKGEAGTRKAIIGNVGDSRVYRFSGGRLEQITEDDDLSHDMIPDDDVRRRTVQAEVSNATSLASMSPDAQAVFKERNVITQALGGSRKIEPHILTVNINSGDFLLITSDGIHDNLTENDIGAILQSAQSTGDAKDQLIGRARAVSEERSFRSKRDDMSCLVIAS